MAEETMKANDFARSADQAKPITIRFSSEIAAQIEAEAQARDASPTEIVRSIVCDHYNESVDLGQLRSEISELIEDRFRHTVYEISRTRSSLYYMVERSEALELDRPKLEEIQRLSRQNATDYIGRLDAEIDRRKNGSKANS
ncbi:MAG TPA: hypothetical protein VMA09_23180 [Candidatus Binataceae bacterium]|nr:hypothetical protein [Candidatus Binataceae bacterium]